MKPNQLINFGTPGFAALGLEPYRVSIKDHRAFLQIPHYKLVPPGCWTVAHIDHTALDVHLVDRPAKKAGGRQVIRHIDPVTSPTSRPLQVRWPLETGCQLKQFPTAR